MQEVLILETRLSMLNLPDGEVLYSQEVIQKRVAELAGEIELVGVEYDCVVCVLKGAIFFFSDLIRAFEKEYTYGFVVASSYTDTRSGAVVIHHDLVGDIRDKHLLLLDDIADTGETIKTVSGRFSDRGAEVTVCCLLNRVKSNSLYIDFTGFEVERPEFLVGYGLDRNDEYRSLPYIFMVESSKLKPR